MNKTYASHLPGEYGPLPGGPVHLSFFFEHITWCGLIVTGNASTGSKIPYNKCCAACRRVARINDDLATA